MKPDTSFHGIRDYREVMPGALYVYKGWEGKERVDVHGVHATSAVAATALIQFCGASSGKAVYWKVGTANQVQYPSVVEGIMIFRPLQLIYGGAKAVLS